MYNLKTKKYIDKFNTDKIPLYWIEKSTGFVIGYALIEPKKDKAIPQTIIRNIKCGKVTDDIFELPSGYTIYDEATGKVVE